MNTDGNVVGAGTDTPQIWLPHDPSRGHLAGFKTIHPSLILFHTSPPLPLLLSPHLSALALASIQTTNHIDGFVFNSLNRFSSSITSLPPSVWVTSRNLGLMNPKRCFGRKPALPSQTGTTCTLAVN